MDINKIKAEIEAIEEWDGGHPAVFVRDSGLFVSAEDGRGFADYYGEFRGNYAWIHPELERIAKAHGGYWEWENLAASG
jgi:hypothetical protein